MPFEAPNIPAKAPRTGEPNKSQPSSLKKTNAQDDHEPIKSFDRTQAVRTSWFAP